MPNLWLVLTTGLLAGGVSCAAVQGSLLATYTAGRVKEGVGDKPGWKEIAVFLLFKLIALTTLGVMLGGLGQKIQLSIAGRAWFQGILAVYMFGVGLALLDVHPFFRRFLLTTPRFLSRWIRREAKYGRFFVPAVLGVSTLFIPCGVTQAMMALALASGSPVTGGLIMGVFAIGTMPIFMAIGMAVVALGGVLKTGFMKTAGILILGMAIFSANSALVLSGSPLNITGIAKEIGCTISFCGQAKASEISDISELLINITEKGYETKIKSIKAGQKTSLRLTNTDGYGCQQAFILPALGISEVVPPGETKIIDITIPNKAGRLAFSCGMGMYGGSIEIVE